MSNTSDGPMRSVGVAMRRVGFLVAVVLVGLKLDGVIALPWTAALAPIWLPIALCIAAVAALIALGWALTLIVFVVGLVFRSHGRANV